MIQRKKPTRDRKNNLLDKDRYNEIEQSYKTGDPTIDAQSMALKDQNYKAYYNQLIQNHNVRANTQKYMNNMLANQGFDTQGYGSSMASGINTDFMNAYNKAEQDYLNRNQQIDQNAMDKFNQKGVESDNQLVGFITETINRGGSTEQIDELLVNSGYKDKEGNYTDKWNALDPERQAYINNAITTGQVGQEETVNPELMAGDTNILNGSFYDENGAVYDIDTKTEMTNAGSDLPREMAKNINNIERLQKSGGLPVGSVLELTFNINGKTIKAYSYFDGKDYKNITKETFDKQPNNKKIRV